MLIDGLCEPSLVLSMLLLRQKPLIGVKQLQLPQSHSLAGINFRLGQLQEVSESPIAIEKAW